MKKLNHNLIVLFIAVPCFSLTSCVSQMVRQNYADANALIHDVKDLDQKPFLKAHLRNGGVAILRDKWEFDDSLNYVMGPGECYRCPGLSSDRRVLKFPIDSVVLFETNQKLTKDEVGRIGALTVMLAANIGVFAYCQVYPKTCYGSCPTFYVNEEDNFHYADAEGFSNAILPSMSYSDIDALSPRVVAGDTFRLTMKNEALETHCVKSVNLLAVPCDDTQTIYQSGDNRFYACGKRSTLISAMAPEGDISNSIRQTDRVERFSTSDPQNLNKREEVYLHFKGVDIEKNHGIIINFRQTMMTTYFIYNGLAYMGDEVTDILSDVEMRPRKAGRRKNGIIETLGKIDVYVWNDQKAKWELQGGVYETGPIAFNTQVVPVQHLSSPDVQVKLVLNKGLWRLDEVALTEIISEVTPAVCEPVKVLNDDEPGRNLRNTLNASDSMLISMPGDAYHLYFALPDDNPKTEYALFLESDGYYLEWMRSYWLADKNKKKLAQMLYRPKKYLKEQAAEYAEYETRMEEEFWNSKINTKAINYYEN